MSTDLCQKWRLPVRPAKPNGVTTAGNFAQSPPGTHISAISCVFPEPPHVHDDLWDQNGQRFLFISDSQIVVQILNGVMPMQGDTYAAPFQRITLRISRLLERDLRPARDHDDPFQWRPRAYNTKADALCNVVLDTRKHFDFLTESLDEIKQLTPNYLVYSDGACRGQGLASLGWAIYAVVWDGGVWTKLLVAMCGRLSNKNACSFLTETLALDEASKMLGELIE